MNVEQIDQPGARLLVVLTKLTQPPREQRHVAMRAAIRLQGEAHGRVLRRKRILRPSPRSRPRDDRLGIRRTDRGTEGDRLLEQLVVGDRLGVYVAMCRVPEPRFIVEDVLVDAATAALRVAFPDRLDPPPDELGRRRDAREVRRLRRERLTVRTVSVACVRAVRIGRLLRAEHAHREPRRRRVLRDPPERRHGERALHLVRRVRLQEVGVGGDAHVLEVPIVRGCSTRRRTPQL